MSTPRQANAQAIPASLRTDDIAPGEVLTDKYVVERVIGVGGIAIVIAARHVELDETFAIKILKPEMQVRPEIIQRFAREAKAAVRIKSEHAARVFDVGVTQGRGPFLVMEYLEGQDLAGRLENSGPLPIKSAADYLIQACEALAVAHVNGIVHRDIKPENLFLARRPDSKEILKVLDFGISKTALTGSAFGVSSDTLKTQELMGTPLYMSPEQIRQKSEVDLRTDIWSLGVTLYELVTGVLPFSADTLTKICALILEGEPSSILQLRKDAPPAVAAIVQRCLAKNPSERFQNVVELASALLPLASSRSRDVVERASAILTAAGHTSGVAIRFESVPPGPMASSPNRETAGSSATPKTTPALDSIQPATSMSTMPSAQASSAGRQRRRGVSVVGALILLLGLGFFAWRHRAAATAAAPAAGIPTARSIVLETDPPGARVEWNGKLLGQTPLTTTFPIGDQAITLSREGYRSETVSLTIASNDAENRKVNLTLSASSETVTPPSSATGVAPTISGTHVTSQPITYPWAKGRAPHRPTIVGATPSDETPAAPTAQAASSPTPTAANPSSPTAHPAGVQVIGEHSTDVKLVQ